MLTQVDILTPQGTLLSLPLDDYSSGFALTDVDGLGPVKATITSSDFAQVDGTQFNAAQRGNRNVVLTLSLEPDYATMQVRDLRKTLYKYLMPKSQVQLKFYDSDDDPVITSGRVETLDPTIFTQDPGVTSSIICFDPDFLALSSTTLSGSTVTTTTEVDVPYDGTSDAGIVFVLSPLRSITDFSIYHRAPDGTVSQMDFHGALVSGDILTISTVIGDKYATLTHSGSNSPILYGIATPTDWIQLQNGDNHIRVLATGAAVPYTISYTKRYGGL